MLKQLTLGAAIVAGALLLTPVSTPASAAPLAPAHNGVVDGANLVQKAHWRHRRHHWRYHYYPYYWGYYYRPYYYRPYYYRPYYYYDDWRWYRRHHRHHHHHHHW